MLFTLTRVARWSLGKAWFRAASSRRSSRLNTHWAREPPSRATGHQEAPASRVAAPQPKPQSTALGNSRPLDRAAKAIPKVPARPGTIKAAPR